ncbi:MAG: GNAT family N-acetyltransferase [Candidatus Omnitrophica bacterium]|nr:GNAT family N-acetyltransferase [Candidatus Omnitrophota bacterium]
MKEGPVIYFRPAALEDCRKIFDWRNNPAARDNSLSSEPVSWQDHERWFKAKVFDPKTLFYVLLAENEKPVGQIRIDLDGSEGIISITVAPEARGRGYGDKGLKAVVDHIFQEKRLSRLVALVKEDNVSSQKIFSNNSFIPNGKRLVGGRSFLEFERLINIEQI